MLPTRDGYMNKTQGSNNVGISKQRYDGNNKFVIRGQFLNLLRDNTFHGFMNEDTNEHMEKPLKLLDSTKQRT